MPTQLRFLRGMLYNYNATGGLGQFTKLMYEFWGYCVNGTSALQTPGGFADSMTINYTISAASNASPIQITTTTTHGLTTGQQVIISGVTGNLAANGTFQITVNNTTQFTLNSTTGNGAYTGGGIVNTTAFSNSVNFTEGTPVLAVGSDGYTSAQVSNTYSGDAFFTSTVNNPFSGAASSLTINGASNNQTTIAAGSNGQTLPQATINVASTVVASTTIAAASNNVTLPQTTINVASTVGFPTAGFIFVTTPAGVQQVNYTGITATTFTGCSGGIGTMSTGNTVNVTFPTAGTINVTTSAGLQTVNYTGITATTLTGCTGGTGTMSTGGLCYMPIQISTTAANAYANLGSPVISGVLGNTTANGTWIVTVPSYNISNTFSIGTNIAFQSNGSNLPQGTINSSTTAPFTTTTAVQTLPQATINVAATNTASTTIAAGSNGAALPQATINVASTTGFPTSGTINVTTSAGVQTVTYTGVGATTFTGCSGGTGTMSTGGAVDNVGFFNAFPTTGTVWIVTTTGTQRVTYTGVTATTLTGCSGGTGNTSVGGSTFTSFSPAGNYTSITAGSNGQILPQGTINVASTTGFPTVGWVYVTTTTGFQVVNYTGVTATSFTGCTGGTGTMATGNAVVTAYAPTGSINVTTTIGTNVVAYTGTTPTTFTGCTGGTGTMATGNSIQSSIFATVTAPTTLTTGESVIVSGVTGNVFANGSWAITLINSTNMALNGSLANGAYTGGGTLTDRSNFILNNSRPNGTYAGSGTSTTANMTGKILTMWKPNSGTSEDSLYIISAVISPNTIKISLNTGGTPDPTTLHPSLTERSNINYRVVDCGAAGATGANNDYFIMQFNPALVGINPGQANSQVRLLISSSSGMVTTLAPGGNWNGLTFPVTGNPQIDAANASNTTNGIFNGGPANTVAVTMSADPCFITMHYKDINSADGSSYWHVEVPVRLYPQAADTNPMVCLNRGGVFSGTVFTISNGAGNDFGRGFFMKGTDNVPRHHYSLGKSLVGDGSPVFGNTLSDLRIAFNTVRGTVLASDCVLSLPAVTNQFALGRCRLRTIKFTSLALPLYHRFGVPNGNQYLNIRQGVAIIWDNTILPTNLFFIL